MMKYSKLIALACGVLTLTSYTPPPSANGEMDAFIDDLMAKMTLTEKVGQLNLLAVPSFVSGNASDDNDSREQLIVDGKLGAMYGSYVAEDLLAAQKLAVEKSRLGIPLMFGYDVIHGLQTVQPIPLAMSTSWNPELIEREAALLPLRLRLPASTGSIRRCWISAGMPVGDALLKHLEKTLFCAVNLARQWYAVIRVLTLPTIPR